MSISNDRAGLLAELEKIARTTHSIEGVVVVGSGAQGFTDDLSDLDVVLVVDPTEGFQAVVESMAAHFVTKPQTLAWSKFKHHDEVYVLCFLFDNMLELDLGIWSLSRLFASKPDWVVSFAKSEKIANKLRSTPEPQAEPRKTAEDLKRSLWINARATVVAIRRKQFLKAAATINSIRSNAVRLVGEMNGFTSDYERKVESLDDPFVNVLRSGMIETAEPQALFKSLETTCGVSISAIEKAGLDVSAERAYLPRLFQLSG